MIYKMYQLFVILCFWKELQGLHCEFVVVIRDSVLVDRLGAEGDVSEEETRIIVCTCIVFT